MWTIIILGITGNLAKRKLIPVLYALARSGLSIGLIVGTGREKNVTPTELLESALPFIDNPTPESSEQFLKSCAYVSLEFNKSEDFAHLARVIDFEETSRFEGIQRTGGRVAYLATYAKHFCEITTNLIDAGIIKPFDMNHRVVYEKPFGNNLAAAQKINACIKAQLDEDQVYRIDHYLAKELVNNILILRYANTLFNAIWNNHYITEVRLLFYEKIDIEGRAIFYDQAGAIKDMIQSHALQILALVTMPKPKALDADDVHEKKAAMLRKVRVVGGLRGQYEGYTEEHNIAPDSTTETYARIELAVDDPDWQGVSFIIETGKAMHRKASEIELILKPISECLWSPGTTADNTCEPNKITIHITPHEGFSIKVNSKKPGFLHTIMPVDFTFSYQNFFGPLTTEAYEILFAEIIRGDHAMVVRFDEVETQWRIVEDIESLNLPLARYKKGTTGPFKSYHHRQGVL